MKLEHFNWFLCHAHSWGISLMQLLAFFTWWKNKNLKCQRRAANEKLISNSGGVMLCVTVCSVSWVQGKTSRCNVPFPTSSSEGTSLFPSCGSQFPQLGLEGRAGEECGLFFPRLDMSSSLDSNHCRVQESLLLLSDILSVSISASSQGCDFGCCSSLVAPWLRAWTSLSPCLGPLCFHSLHICAVPSNRERELPKSSWGWLWWWVKLC